MLTRYLVPVAVGAVVAGVAAGGAVALHGHHSPGAADAGAPPPASVRRAGSPVMQIAPIYGGTALRLPGGGRLDLPAAPHGRVPAYRVAGNRAPVSEVRRLAAALGLAGTPHREVGGWSVSAAGHRLVVRDTAGAPWQYGATGCVPPASATRGLVCNGPAIVGVIPPAAVRRILAAEHQAGADVQRSAAGSVIANPRVGGLPTSGLATTLGFGNGRLVLGSGWLEPTTTVFGVYPMEPLARALPPVGGPPHAYPMCMAAGDAPCGLRIVRSAQRGLLVERLLDGDLVLAPAWLVTTTEGASVGVLAVAPPYVRLGGPIE